MTLALVLLPRQADAAGWQAAASPGEPADPVEAWLESAVEEYHLDNGWTFLLVQRPGVPLVSFETRDGAGPGGSTGGLTELLARLAFNGSDRVGTRDWATERVELELLETRAAELEDVRRHDEPEAVRMAEEAFREARGAAASLAVEGELRGLYETAGSAGSLGAEACADGMRTFVSLPANQVELWCWLEAERVERPVLRGFYREREALVRERQRRFESDPAQVALEELQLAAFRRHPYREPILGFPADIARETRTDALEFLRQHRGRSSLVTALVGNFDVEAVKALLERYLDAPSGASTAAPITVEEPAQRGERRVEVAGNEPLLAIGWRVPARGHPHAAAVDVALRLLAHSRGARLHRRIVQDEPLAASMESVRAWPGARYEHLAVLLVRPLAGVSPTSIESVIDEELALFSETGPDAEELTGVQRVARAEQMRALRDAPRLAALLAEYQLETGDWRTLTRELSAIEAVTSDEVREALALYFTRENRTVVTVVAPEEALR